MTWILLLAVFGAVWWIDVEEVTQRPWWPVLQLTALLVGAFVVILGVEVIRARWQSRRRAPER